MKYAPQMPKFEASPISFPFPCTLITHMHSLLHGCFFVLSLLAAGLILGRIRKDFACCGTKFQHILDIDCSFFRRSKNRVLYVNVISFWTLEGPESDRKLIENDGLGNRRQKSLFFPLPPHCIFPLRFPFFFVSFSFPLPTFCRSSHPLPSPILPPPPQLSQRPLASSTFPYDLLRPVTHYYVLLRALIRVTIICYYVLLPTSTYYY